MNRRGFLGMLAGLVAYFFPRKTVAKLEPFTDMWGVEVDDPMSVTDGDFLTMLSGLKAKYPNCTGEYLISVMLNPNPQQSGADLVRDWRKQIDTHKRAYIRAQFTDGGIPCRLTVLESDKMGPLLWDRLERGAVWQGAKIQTWAYYREQCCTTKPSEISLYIYDTFYANEITEYYNVRRYPLWKEGGFEQGICIPVK